jgi:hypothetical protein
MFTRKFSLNPSFAKEGEQHFSPFGKREIKRDFYGFLPPQE